MSPKHVGWGSLLGLWWVQILRIGLGLHNAHRSVAFGFEVGESPFRHPLPWPDAQRAAAIALVRHGLAKGAARDRG